MTPLFSLLHAVFPADPHSIAAASGLSLFLF
jgi:hypothetical protein